MAMIYNDSTEKTRLQKRITENLKNKNPANGLDESSLLITFGETDSPKPESTSQTNNGTFLIIMTIITLIVLIGFIAYITK